MTETEEWSRIGLTNQYEVTDLQENLSWRVGLLKGDPRGRIDQEVFEEYDGTYIAKHDYKKASMSRLSTTISFGGGIVETWEWIGPDTYQVTYHEVEPDTGKAYTGLYTATLWHHDIRGRVIHSLQDDLLTGKTAETDMRDYYKGRRRLHSSATTIDGILVEQRSHSSGNRSRSTYEADTRCGEAHAREI